MAAVIGSIKSGEDDGGRMKRSQSILEVSRGDAQHDELELEKNLMNQFLKMNDGDAMKALPWFPPEKYIYNDPHHNVAIEYKLNMFQRVFVMMEQHNSSKGAMVFASIITTCIVLGCVCFILAEEPEWANHHTVECTGPEDVVCDYSETITFLDCPVAHRRRLSGDDDHADDDHNEMAVHCNEEYPMGTTANGTVYCPCVVDPLSQYCPGRQVCKPHHDVTLEGIESVCMFIFTLEYITLLVTVPFAPSRLAHTMPHEWDDEHHYHKPDPVYPVWWQMWSFFSSWKMLIDLATLLPFYIFIDTNPFFYPHATGGGNFNFIRVFRLLRILHIFKISRKNQILALVERTMKLSMPTMILTCYLTAIHMVFWGSLVHFFEQGEWRSGSTFETFSEFPDGTYMRMNHLNSEWEPSPFNSIAIGIYWTIMMTTTTGVGNDLQPTTDGGRACAAIVACMGVILMAIPIGVVGLNFSQEWEKMKLKFLTSTELGPVQHVRMFESRVIHVHAASDEETADTAFSVKEKSEATKMAEEITILNQNLANSLSKVVEGQREMVIHQESAGEFMNKITVRLLAVEKEKMLQGDDGK